MNRMHRYRMGILLLLVSLCLSFQAPAQESDSAQDAETLLKQAIEKKHTGKTEEAILLFEKAIRTNRGILGQDDEGLIKDLRNYYEKKLETSSDDIAVLEPLGFIYAVCFSDFEKAIAHYTKVAQLAKEEKVKTRTNALIDRLKAQWELTKSTASNLESQTRDEKVKEWKELEKQEALAAISDRVGAREEKLRDMSQKKEELEARLPQEEDKIKELEEEVDKADLYWRTTENRMYRRKRERLSGEVDQKKGEISRLKSELERITRDLEQLQKEADAEQNILNRKAGQSGTSAPNDNPDNPNGTPEGSAEGNPEGTPDSSAPPGENRPLTGEGTTGDPALPTTENPDFPKETPGEDSGNPEAGSDTGAESGSEPSAEPAAGEGSSESTPPADQSDAGSGSGSGTQWP